MAQNIYDQQDFFAGYSQLERSVHGLAGAPEWPVLRDMLPDPAGLRIVDLGCGFGWFCRWAREHDAADVVGIDLSDRMLARARSETNDPGITYRSADLEDIALPAATFDLAYSSLAFHYVADIARLFGVIFRALVPGGWLVFSIEHPIYMAPGKPAWSIDADGRMAWPIDNYLREGTRSTDWLSQDVIKHHRTIATTLNTLRCSGFSLERVEEFCPTAAQIAANPGLAPEIHRPMFMMVAARR